MLTESLMLTALILLALLQYYVRSRTRLTIWKKQLHIEQHSLSFERLYIAINGFILSKQARMHQDACEYVYGEIVFVNFCALLSLVSPAQDTIFYDLGSGVGKAVLACAMVFPVKKSVGIELFSELHQAAHSVKQQLSVDPAYIHTAHRVEFIQGNFLETDFSDATLIFINATALFGDSWHLLNQKLDHAAHCQIIITTSKKLINSAYQVIKIVSVAMSWGIVQAYIHQRTIS